MPQVFSANRRVEFRDTDAAGIMHFSAYLVHMEAVEHAFLRSLGMSVVERTASGTVTWPRVHVECDYSGAARFEDELTIELGISRLGDRSVHYSFAFRLGERLIAQGAMAAVCCRVLEGGKLESMTIPEATRARLAPYVSP